MTMGKMSEIEYEARSSDDLVTRLRDFPVRDCCSQRAEAANRIEQLEAALMVVYMDALGMDDLPLWKAMGGNDGKPDA